MWGGIVSILDNESRFLYGEIKKVSPRGAEGSDRRRLDDVGLVAVVHRLSIVQKVKERQDVVSFLIGDISFQKIGKMQNEF